MFIDIFFSLLQAAIIIAAIIGFIAMCIKNPKVLVIVLFVTFCLVGLVIAPTVAEEATVARSIITHVAPSFLDNYPILIVTVETFDGEVYTYYAEEEVDTTGIITLVLVDNEVKYAY